MKSSLSWSPISTVADIVGDELLGYCTATLIYEDSCFDSVHTLFRELENAPNIKTRFVLRNELDAANESTPKTLPALVVSRFFHSLGVYHNLAPTANTVKDLCSKQGAEAAGVLHGIMTRTSRLRDAVVLRNWTINTEFVKRIYLKLSQMSADDRAKQMAKWKRRVAMWGLTVPQKTPYRSKILVGLLMDEGLLKPGFSFTETVKRRKPKRGLFRRFVRSCLSIFRF
jgi:hypothetical protein